MKNDRSNVIKYYDRSKCQQETKVIFFSPSPILCNVVVTFIIKKKCINYRSWVMGTEGFIVFFFCVFPLSMFEMFYNKKF